jgi:hypothetical protein
MNPGFLVSPLIACLGITFIEIPNRAQQVPTVQQSSSGQFHRRIIDIENFPIVEFSSSIPDDPKRQARGKHYDRSDWSVDPRSNGDTTIRFDSVDSHLKALPKTLAIAIIKGTVMDARAFLSNDKTGVYSSFAISVEDIIKNSGDTVSGRMIEAERDGGRVKYPSGRIHSYIVSEQSMPKLGASYILFLKSTTEDCVFEIITGYEIREESVYPLDELAKTRDYDGKSLTDFLSELKRENK